jgi:hypothetical protein
MYEILMRGTQELMRTGLVEDIPVVGYLAGTLQTSQANHHIFATALLELIDECFCGRSGRPSRKLPFLALSSCLQKASAPIPIELYCRHLRAVAEEQLNEASMN